MTPQERQMIDDLFDRLSKVEAAPRDRDASSAIAQGLQRAPNAVYALVQTVLVQDEALKRAHDRITELEEASAPQQAPQGGFLDSMRDAVFGQSQPAQRGSVPNVPPPASRPVWNSGQVIGQPPQQQGGYNQGGYAQPSYGQQQPYGQPQESGGGSSFLGTAAAAAAGMVGGSLLLGSIRSMMGGSHAGFGGGSAFGDSSGISPWSSDQSGGSLSRDAGLNDIGSNRDDSYKAGAFDQAQADADQDQDQDQDDDDRDAMDMDSDNDSGSDYV